MQVTRRLALLLSLGLVVAVAVGALLRVEHVKGERDGELTASVERASESAGRLIDVVEVAGLTDADPAAMVRALVSVQPGAQACVVTADGSECDGDGPTINDVELEALRDHLDGDSSDATTNANANTNTNANANTNATDADDAADADDATDADDAADADAADDDAAESDSSGSATTVAEVAARSAAGGGETGVAIYDGTITLTVERPTFILALRAWNTIVDADAADEIDVWVAAASDEAPDPETFVDGDGRRQTSSAVEGAPGIIAVATGPGDVSLPATERKAYAISAILGLVLLAIASATVFFEQRNLKERASIDPLTRIPNRAEFGRLTAEHLDVTEPDKASGCLLLFDLDDFKQVNDSFGHRAGDEVLSIVAGRLRSTTRDGDVVARWGGDEFVVFLPGVADEEMARRRAAELSEAVSGRARIDSIEASVRLRASVGIAIAPDHGSSLTELVERADAAMYRAKRRVGQVATRRSKQRASDRAVVDADDPDHAVVAGL